MFNILPYLEEQALRDLGKGLQASDRIDAIVRRDATPISIMNCPTRRAAIPYPNSSSTTFRNSGRGDFHARGDYAMNIGDTIGYEHWCFHFAPNDYDDADADPNWGPPSGFFSGISYCGSQVRVTHVKDGTSHTYAIGERYLDPAHYADGADSSDNAPMYAGLQQETYRSTYFDDSVPPTSRSVRLPHRDKLELDLKEHFGSAHASGCYMSMCDGSVRLIPYDIDGHVHARRGNRADGLNTSGF